MLNYYCLKIAIITALFSLSFPVQSSNRIKYPLNIKENSSTIMDKELAAENLEKAIAIVDLTISTYFDPDTFEMKRFYNPFTKEKSEETASVWMYSAGIEAVNAVLSALKTNEKYADKELYKANYSKYEKLLVKLYDNLEYYLGTFELTSFTQTKVWSVYAVDRVKEKGKANVAGILNVYDDQMWLLRELIHSYKLTGNIKYLEKAEYLTDYVLDGWDGTLDRYGKENGGIPWGPGYTTKHACSNSPLISSLVWLHNLYKGKKETIKHRYIDTKDGKTRISKIQSKDVYYLDYAKKIYAWQKEKLLNAEGLYSDMLGGCIPDCNIKYEEVHGAKYRTNTELTKAVGEAYSYNTGTMISAAVDLYLATNRINYEEDAKTLTKKSFQHFAVLGKDLPEYYSFGTNGFKNWFNGILLRGYYDLASINSNYGQYLQPFQKNLDYGYKHFNEKGFLPSNLLKGWEDDKNGKGVEGMFMFTFAAEYALLAEYYYEL